ncbi:unnamed protein product [Rotaria socialis]
MFHVILAVGFSFVYIIHSVPCVMALDQEQPIDINGSLFVKPGVGKTFRALHFPNATRTFKLRGNQTNNLFTLIEGKIQIGEGPKLHVHHNEDETFRVIRGQLQFIIGNETFCAPTGSVVYGRRGINMSFINVDSPDAYVEFLFSPSVKPMRLPTSMVWICLVFLIGKISDASRQRQMMPHVFQFRFFLCFISFPHCSCL